MSKAKLLGNLKDFAIIKFGAALAAAGIFFMIPSNVSIGSGSALPSFCYLLTPYEDMQKSHGRCRGFSFC